MYTFNKIPAESPSLHSTFYIYVFLMVLVLLYVLFIERPYFLKVLFLSIFGGLLVYNISFHWTDQSPIVYKNEKHIGVFVRFVAESYKESRQSGKMRYEEIVHKQYVEYKVNGNYVLLPAEIGTEYPPRVYLYKN